MQVLEKSLMKYIRQHWRGLCASILAGLSVSVWGLPIFAKLVMKGLSDGSSVSFFLALAIGVFVLLALASPLSNLLWRNRNNARLSEIPFTYIDAIGMGLASTVVSSVFLYHPALVTSRISESVRWSLTPFLIFLIGWLSYLIYRSSRGYKTVALSPPGVNSTEYFPDEPITSEAEDILGRGKFVNGLYRQIIEYPLTQPFVFGLYAAWGEGKTSVLNLLRKKLQENDRIIIFDFDPWYFHSSVSIAKSFYSGLAGAINRQFFLPNAQSTLVKYQDILVSGLKRLSGIEMSLGFHEESIEELRDRIEHLIDITCKRIVVLVDDLDRLDDKNRVLEVLALVKLSANFKNTIFVLSLDPSVVERTLSPNAVSHSGFLEKIVQAPLHVPAADQVAIDRYLYFSDPGKQHISAIDRLFQQLELPRDRIHEFENEFTYLFQAYINRLFPTVRRAKRYLNALYQTLPSIHSEVYLQDFLILELLRIFYDKIYSDIWNNYWRYLPGWGERALLIIPPSLWHDEEARYEGIRTHINALVEEIPQKDIVLELLKKLFPEIDNAFKDRGRWNHDHLASSYRAAKRISHPDVFPRYFMLNVPSSDIPDGVIEELISSWNSSSESDFETRLAAELDRARSGGKLQQLMRRLVIFVSRFETDAARRVVRALYRTFESFSGEGREALGGSEQDAVSRLMQHLLNEKIPAAEITGLLVEIIENIAPLHSAVEFCLLSKPGESDRFHNISQHVNFNNLSTALARRLERYLDILLRAEEIFLGRTRGDPFLSSTNGLHSMKQPRQKLKNTH